MNARSSRPGCFGYGCMIAVVLFVIVIGGTAWWAIKSIRGGVVEYTSTDTPPLAVPTIDGETVSVARTKFVALQDAYRTNKPLSVALSEAELRAIVEESSWHNMVEFVLRDNQTRVSFSFPLAMLGEWEAASIIAPDLSKRSAVGSATGVFGVKDGVPSLSLSELTLNGKELGDMARGHAGEWIVGALVSALGLDEHHGDAEAADVDSATTKLLHIRNLSVQNGSVMVELVGK